MSRFLNGTKIFQSLNTQQLVIRFHSSFSASKRGEFFQSKPEITNQFLEDPFLIEQLELEIPEPVKNRVDILIFLNNLTITFCEDVKYRVDVGVGWAKVEYWSGQK